MNMAIVIDEFQQFEEKYGYLVDEIDGFRYWAYIRFSLYMQIEDVLNNQGRPSVNNYRPSIKEVFSIIKNLTIKNPLLYKQHKQILFFTHARRSLVGEKYECIYTDRIRDEFPENSISGEFIFGTRHLEPAYTKNLLKLDVIDVWPAVVLKIFNGYFKKRDAALISQFNKIGEDISSKIYEVFSVNIAATTITQMIIKRYYWHRMKKRFLTRLIVNISPSVIVEVVGYETNKLIINEIANDLGIPTIELQHGVIGRGHLAYNYKVKRNYPFLPRYIFMFAQYWKDECNFPIDDKNKIITGFPYMESQIKRYPILEKKINDPIVILVLSQPEFSKKLKGFITDAIKLAAEKGLKVKFIYKLHPSEYRLSNKTWSCFEEYDNVSIVNNTAIPLYTLFAQADIQVGVTSTAVFEGLAYKLKTFIYHIEKTETYMGNLVSHGEAEFVEDANELIKYISTFNRNEVWADKNRSFFTEDALKNIKTEIERIRNKNEREH